MGNREGNAEKSEAASIDCPAKINLFLAVTTRRPDGFHGLVSLVAPLDWGDRLECSERADGIFSLVCDDPDVPVDGRNLVLRTAGLFRERTGWAGGAAFSLTKRVPVGAGLGGGSGDAAGALRLLEGLSGLALNDDAAGGLLAEVGSDCPALRPGCPVWMRGRGERVMAAGPELRRRLRGRRVILFKPSVSISTAWAYGALAREGGYLPEERAERLAAGWENGEEAFFNSFEPVVMRKFPGIGLVLEEIRAEAACPALLSGSGSAGFALPVGADGVERIKAIVRSAWGPDAWIVDTGIQ